MTDRKHAISYNEAAKRANVHRNTIIVWVKQGLLTCDEIAGHPIIDEQELAALVAVRATDRRHWQHAWREKHTQRKEAQ